MSIYHGPLGRLPASDDRHLQRWSITPLTLPSVIAPIVVGTLWYGGFDRPTRGADGAFWLPKPEAWGSVRGGHAYCLRPPGMRDLDGWWHAYDQGREGACVGFATARALSLMNRERYDGRRIYLHARTIDEWPGEDYEGTSVRAGLDVVREHGPHRMFRGGITGPDLADGIAVNRWATAIEDIAYALDPASAGQRVLDAGYVTFLNSWGAHYPHYTRMDLEWLNRLVFRDDGDAAIITDR